MPFMSKHSGEFRLLICGDRRWKSSQKIMFKLYQLFKEHGSSLTVITGGCRGADYLADNSAEALGIDRVIFPANWVGRRKGAGPIRNQKMLDWTNPDLVWAFHRNITKSKGTKDMVNRAKKAGIEVKVFKK